MRASGQNSKGTLFATVDIQKISDGYKEKIDLETKFRDMQTQWEAKLSRRDNMPLLSEDEQKQLDAIYAKGAGMSDADKATAKTLTDKAKSLNDELVALRQKKDADLTPADKTRLTQLEGMISAASEQLNSMKDQMNTALHQFDTDNSDLLAKNIRAAVAKVAQQKGISIVFNSQVALYAGTDITQPVLDALNK
jgi:Skp family chaperone for outer membrane proteins